MAKASRELPCAARVPPQLLISTEQQLISFLSLFHDDATEEQHTPTVNQSHNARISPCRRYSRYTILSSLLSSHDDVRHGMLIHHYMVCKQLESSPFLGSHLLHMYFRCKSSENGFALSASMSDLNTYSFNYLMEAFIDTGENQKPLQLFDRMQGEALLPNRVTFLTVIKALAPQPVGFNFVKVHAYIKNCEHGQDNVLGTALLKVYGEWCRIHDATKLFNSMVQRDVVLWTTMINLYAEEVQFNEAFHLYETMQQEGLTPTMVTFVSLLSVCAKHATLNEGENLHYHIVAEGLVPDIVLGNALVNMYGKCGSLDDARSVFENMLEKNVVTWTSMITLYAQKGYGKLSLVLFHRMQAESILPNRFTFVGRILGCACIGMLDEGKQAHTQISESEGVDAVAGAALVNMYDKCGSLEDAEKIFGSIVVRDLVLWNAMVSAYAQNGKLKKAMELLESMQAHGMCPDKVTFTNIFSLCGNCGQMAHGEWVHAYIMESGLEPELIVGNSLAHMHAHCGDLDHARRIFDNLMDRDVVSWTVMIAAYAAQGHCETAFEFFDQMQQQGLLPDKVTYLSILDSCVSSSSQSYFKRMHARLEKCGFVDMGVALQNALITLFGKWGNLQDAERIFSTMLVRDVVTWNTMLSLYIGIGKTSRVFEIFKQMLTQEVRPNKVTLVSVVSACASQTLFIEGKHIHTLAVESNFHMDIILGTAFITMYGKCGSIVDARKCFDLMHKHKILTWNAMMVVYSQHGQGKEAIQIFQQMQQEKLAPDALSFLAVLVACSHSGLADEGKKLFTAMIQEYDILPSADHCGCLIDLLGRSGRLDEAEALLQSLPSQSRNAPFVTMLGACKSEGNRDRGERVGMYALESDFVNSGYYVILSNICSSLVKDDRMMTNMISSSGRSMSVQS